MLRGDYPECICNHGYTGTSCSACLPRFTGEFCESCVANYIGWNDTCSVPCHKGVSSVPGGDECQCYADEERGFWTGETCSECQEGFALPFCTECAVGKFM